MAQPPRTPTGSGSALARTTGTMFVSTRAHRLVLAPALFVAAFAVPAPGPALAAGDYRLVGWNNLGMHCMDADYSVFSLLPPFNTIDAQLIGPDGALVTSPGGISVTYQAVSDPAGSLNATSIGKTNFWEHVEGLFGVPLEVDRGLFGADMPGPANVPQPMRFDASTNWFQAEGIPIVPVDDAGLRNTYPMMRLVARDAAGALLATTDVVLPVSDEMTCKACHASGTSEEARPDGGWIVDADPERDFRLNVLALHDDRRSGGAAYRAALATAGYDETGLLATARGGRAVLCASCHSSEALPGSGQPGISPLTQAIHRSMASATDPASGMRLDDTRNRAACYRCHPGSETRCLRGAMGAAVASDGSLAMQCQSCHGGMLEVASPLRTGWIEEPRCDSCHTGTATHNNGAIRYLSVFEADGSVREAVDPTFATNDDVPAAGLSLYRFSKGHGGLQCSACHGATHAEYPSSHASDNVQSIALQGHAGVLSECSACHLPVPSAADGGPHGLHPLGAQWVSRHGDVVERSGVAACRSCHGGDSRGTVLSRSQADRTLATDYGTKRFWKGFQIGCYTCHRGPTSDDANPNRPAAAVDARASTAADRPLAIALGASDPDGNALALRIVSQPLHGTVGLVGKDATYFPDGSFVGEDLFTFAAWDGSTDSNLATVRVTVGEAACPETCRTPSGCDPDCLQDASVDAVVAAPRPVRAVIRRRVGRATHEIALDVSNLGSSAGTIRLEAFDGDCPAGTVTAASFGSYASASADTADLGAGQSAQATITVELVSEAFYAPGRRAPARCAIAVRATTVGSTDPTPDNAEVSVEIDVVDRADGDRTGEGDPYVVAARPVSVSVERGSDAATRLLRVRVARDRGGSDAPLAVTVSTDDGTCAPGTMSAIDLDPAAPGLQDTATLAPGRRARGRGQIRVAAATTSTASGTPRRCTALVSVAYEGAGGDATNDATRVTISATDRNDF